MNIDSKQFPQHLLKDVRQNFGFLLDRGYEIVSTSYHSGYYDGYWEVLIKSPDFSLKMVNDQTELICSFGSQSKGYMSVRSMIYFLSGEKEVLGASAGMKKYGNMMAKYIDEIETRFRDDHSRFRKAIQSSQKRYDDVISSRSLSIAYIVLGIMYILGVVSFFYLYNELVFGWWLSGWLLDNGYRSSSWIIRGVSLLLAAGTVYMIDRYLRKSDDSSKNIAVSKRKATKRNPILMAIILFPLFWVAFAFLIGIFLSFVPWGDGFEIVFPIITFGLSLLLALWIVSSIYKSNRR